MATDGKRERRPKLGAQVLATLRGEIALGRPAPGHRLPTEPELSDRFQVSRTVIREVIAELRADGLVESRQGIGVFVLRRQRREFPASMNPRAAEKISDVIEELELRGAIEIEAAGLAAERASPAQEAEIGQCFRNFCDFSRRGQATAEADFALHMAIARATNNPRFEAFLSQLGARTIPRNQLRGVLDDKTLRDRGAALEAEHRSLIEAVLGHDAAAARTAMRVHLLGALERYRALARQLAVEDLPGED